MLHSLVLSLPSTIWVLPSHLPSSQFCFHSSATPSWSRRESPMRKTETHHHLLSCHQPARSSTRNCVHHTEIGVATSLSGEPRRQGSRQWYLYPVWCSSPVGSSPLVSCEASRPRRLPEGETLPRDGVLLPQSGRRRSIPPEEHKARACWWNP